MRIFPQCLRYQQGASLITSLILLGVLALMGVAGVMIANTQFKIAGNLQFQSAAMSDAESALAVAENWLPANFAHQGFADSGTIRSPHSASAPNTTAAHGARSCAS